MSSVRADFENRQRITFTARGRTQVNDRSPGDDGPVGYTSTELLLIAVGNCMLGTLLGSPLLEGFEIPHAIATLEATMAPDPPRVVRIETNVELQMEGDVAGIAAELEQISCNCPMCNSLTAERVVRVRASQVAAV